MSRLSEITRVIGCFFSNRHSADIFTFSSVVIGIRRPHGYKLRRKTDNTYVTGTILRLNSSFRFRRMHVIDDSNRCFYLFFFLEYNPSYDIQMLKNYQQITYFIIKKINVFHSRVFLYFCGLFLGLIMYKLYFKNTYFKHG